MSVMRVTGPGTAPTRAYNDDAGFDLYTHGYHEIEARSFADVDCGVAIELPVGMWGRICGRSSTIRQRGLLVVEGIIDSGYRGRLFAGVWNLTDQPVAVNNGERIAQFIPFHNAASEIRRVERVEQLTETDRGASGFGSSGQ